MQRGIAHEYEYEPKQRTDPVRCQCSESGSGSDALISQAREFQQAMMMYTCAIREVKTKFEVLNDELSIKNQRNPIEMIKSRVKKPLSIVEKLQRRNLPVTLESMINHLDDVAGIRVICSFVDDIYAVANMLVSQDDITVIAIKDYIKNPKPNGYRSYHLIIEIRSSSPKKSEICVSRCRSAPLPWIFGPAWITS